jgi:hypothetical protein
MESSAFVSSHLSHNARCSLVRFRRRDAKTLLAELLTDPLPIAADLDMRGIGASHGTRQTQRSTDTIDQLEKRGGVAGTIAVLIGNPEIGGVSIAPAFGLAGPAMPGLTAVGSEPGGDALAVVVAEGR